MLKTEFLTMRFGGLTAVSNVNMDIGQHELVGVIGPNGAGKTTLFSMITGFYEPSEGKVFFDNQEVTNWRPHKITCVGLCRTFQITKPFQNLTVLENVLIGSLWYENNMGDARCIAREALDQVGLLHIAGDKAKGLPIGYRKKLELARVLAAKPKVVLLDEVMGGLTPPEVKEMSDVIARIHAMGTGVVMIEHVMSAVMSLSQRIIVLNQGQVIAAGTPEEVRNNEQVIEAYLGKKYAHAAH
ncbi:MAG: ABC transporter ATP-binding protein [Desulfovibrionaceae bacterium]|nr:ABC transporter ATP-binding protein [Desulfovibrionaceae bacterium]